VGLGNSGCDVFIVGGGPAGLAAAIALRQRGADVLLADAVRPPIDKACGEGLMPDARLALAHFGVELDPRQAAEFAGILFAGAGARVAAHFPNGTGLGVRRTTLHTALLERAHHLGVRMVWGAPVTLHHGDIVKIDGQPCPFRWLIAADGQTSRVRSWAGLDRGSIRSRRFGFRRHYRVQPWSRFVEVHWGALGQACITPVAADEICVATVTHDRNRRLDAIMDSLPALREQLAGAQPTGAVRGAMTVTRRLRRVTRGNVALIGDASGSVDSITGEGIALGFRQAVLLAESLERGSLSLYAARHGESLRRLQRMAALLLLMDRYTWGRELTLPLLAAHPAVFRSLLALHVGEDRTFRRQRAALLTSA
jgi:menaquinone-9 beta-reductase